MYDDVVGYGDVDGADGQVGGEVLDLDESRTIRDWMVCHHQCWMEIEWSVRSVMMYPWWLSAVWVTAALEEEDVCSG